MKINFVKKLALGLAFTVAVGSVPTTNVAAAEANYPSFKSVTTPENRKELKVGKTKKYYTKDSEKWALKRINVGNDDVATARFSRTKKFIKVTGVSVGQTQIRAVFKNYKTKEVYKEALLHVDVKAVEQEQEKEEPVVVAAKLTTVKQTAANAFTATFTTDASKKFNKDSFSVAAVDGSSVLSVKSVEFSADGLSAVVTLYTNFDNGTTYNVSCGTTTVPLTAAIGEVSKVIIHTDSAQENVKTPIEFTLFDANGIDVTPSIDLDSNCVVTITGTYSGANLDKASTAFITMNGVGTTADVTVLYNSNKVGAADITTTQTITCVDSKAVIGTKLFANTSNINNNSECAKFYLGLSSQEVDLEVGSTTDDVYFCAKDDNGDVISYDYYEVQSSNDDIMTVSIVSTENTLAETDSGKFARFMVNANRIGTAQINITAMKNGKMTKYTIPVAVTNINEAVKMDINVTRPIMSDVDDADYEGMIIPQLYDAKGNPVKGTFEYELVTKTSGTELQLKPTEGNARYTAADAIAKTYTVKVTGADNKTGKTFVKNINITVKALPVAADPSVVSGTGIKVTYQIETNNTAFNIEAGAVNENGSVPSDVKATTSNTPVSTRLYATYNGLFAGYVRSSDVDVENNAVTGSGITVAGGYTEDPSKGVIKVHPDTELYSANVLVRFGNLVFNTDSNLLNNYKVIEEADDNYASMLESIGTAEKTYRYVLDADSDNDIEYGEVGTLQNKYLTKYNGTINRTYNEVGRSGLYVIEYELVYNIDHVAAQAKNDGSTAKPVKKTQSFTITDKVVMPTVSVTSRKIYGTGLDDVKKNLTTNVDMNNNISEYESIIGMYDASGNDSIATTSKDTKLTVKYAEVEDNYGKDWNFWVPINTTFTIE